MTSVLSSPFQRHSRFSAQKLTPPLFPQFWGVPIGPGRLYWSRSEQVPKLFSRGIISEVFQPILSRYLNVTDRETDRRLSMAKPRAVKKTVDPFASLLPTHCQLCFSSRYRKVVSWSQVLQFRSRVRQSSATECLTRVPAISLTARHLTCNLNADSAASRREYTAAICNFFTDSLSPRTTNYETKLTAVQHSRLVLTVHGLNILACTLNFYYFTYKANIDADFLS